MTHPTHEYRPEDPRPVLGTASVLIEDSNVENVLSVTKNAVVRAKLSDLLGFDASKNKEKTTSVRSKLVKTETLTQHRDALANLLSKHRVSIERLLADNQNKGYMIVGVKSCIDPEVSTSRVTETDVAAKVKIPLGQATQMASHDTVGDLPALDISAEGGSTRQGTSRATFQGQGEQVFAIQYRLLTLSKKRASLLRPGKQEVQYGALQYTNFEDGVYSGSKQDLVYEDDSDEEEAVELCDVNPVEQLAESQRLEIM